MAPHPHDDIRMNLREARDYSFTMMNQDDYRSIRSGLEARGWKAVKKETADVWWTLDERSIAYDRLDERQIVNHFKDISAVATKSGLTRTMAELRWHASEDPSTFFPRSYVLDNSRSDFIDDFRRTAAAGVLRWLVDGDERTPVVARLVRIALRVCEAWIADLRGEEMKIVVTDQEWDDLLVYSYLTASDKHDLVARRPVTAKGEKTRPPSGRWRTKPDVGVRGVRDLAQSVARPEDRAMLRHKAAVVLKNLSAVWPQYRIDGSRNVWVVKAPEACRGHGIVLLRRLDDILGLADRMPGRVVQKYVERPFLWSDDDHSDDTSSTSEASDDDTEKRDEKEVGTKFDLRLWCLVRADTSGVDVFVYDPCYARLCSRPFTLSDAALGTPVAHLTNLAVQRREGISEDDALMRTQSELATQLRRLNRGAPEDDAGDTIWQRKVWPGIQRILTALSAAVVATAAPRPRSFELLGVDVVLDESGTPWLLEANLSPAMARRSSAHAATIAAMQRGVLRLTVDRWINPLRPGDDEKGWKLVCSHSMPPPMPAQAWRASNLAVVGVQPDVHRVDVALSLLSAHSTLRRWWSTVRVRREHKKRRRRAAALKIGRAVRRRFLKKHDAARVAQRTWRNFRVTRATWIIVALRKTRLLKIQAAVRGLVTRRTVAPFQKKARQAATIIANGVRRWRWRRILAARASAIEAALATAAAAHEFAFLDRLTIVTQQVATARCRLTALYSRSAVKLQGLARRRAAKDHVARLRSERRRFRAATVIQGLAQSYARRRARRATTLQRMLRECQRRRRERQVRNRAARHLQRRARQFRHRRAVNRADGGRAVAVCAVHARVVGLLAKCRSILTQQARVFSCESRAADVARAARAFVQFPLDVGEKGLSNKVHFLADVVALRRTRHVDDVIDTFGPDDLSSSLLWDPCTTTKQLPAPSRNFSMTDELTCPPPPETHTVRRRTKKTRPRHRKKRSCPDDEDDSFIQTLWAGKPVGLAY